MNAAQHILAALVRLYQCTISPVQGFLFGPMGRCRFTPTCSAYAREAIMIHGALAGSWLALKRLARCHPWGDCGSDPVPQPPTGLAHPADEPTAAGRHSH